MERSVLVWQETIVLPTYNTGTPEKNPIFLEKRVYQGSSGTVYPHAVVEKIEDEKRDKEYTALFLENDYLKIMILPELVAGFIVLMIRSGNVILFIITRS